MPNRNRFKSSLRRKVFEITGFPLEGLLRQGALLVVAAVGITAAVLYVDTKPNGDSSENTDLRSDRRTSEELYIEVSEIPTSFADKLPVERIEILQAKAEAGEELIRSGGRHYADRTIDQLVTIYGGLCQLQDSAGVDSQKSFRRLAELRQQAFAAGNEDRVAAADFTHALAATNRLSRFSEQTDFRFAADAVINLNSKHLVDVVQLRKLCADAIYIHDHSTDQKSTGIFLSLLADKLNGSPVSEISNLGLTLKDHAKYSRYYAAVKALPGSSREAKVQFYEEMLGEIEKSPPQSSDTYEVIFRLLDRLLNSTDVKLASTLTKRLGRAASLVSPKIKAEVDQSINNINLRMAELGEIVELSGSKSNGKQFELPNGKPTHLLFWRFGDKESMERLWQFTHSEQFDSWDNDVILACLASLSEDQISNAEEILSKFTVLDNDTSDRLRKKFGIDLLPYFVSLDKDGKVIRLGVQTN